MTKRSSSDSTPSANNDYVSVGFWMFAQFLLVLPLVNLIAVLLFALVGGNRSRQNFFRALLVWFVLFLVLHLVILLFVGSSVLLPWFKHLWGAFLDLVPAIK